MASALEKIFSVLEVLAQGPCTGVVAAKLTGLNRSTVNRLFGELEVGRFVVPDLLGRYCIGPRLAELFANCYQDSLKQATDDILTDLQDCCFAHAALFRPDGLDRVCIGLCASPNAPDYRELQVGTRFEVSLCASALTLLAWDAQRRFAAGHLGVTNQQFSNIRKKGWAATAGRAARGAISAPVRNRAGEVIASIAIFGTSGIANPAISAALAPKVVAAGNHFSDLVVRLGG